MQGRARVKQKRSGKWEKEAKRNLDGCREIKICL